MKAFALALCLLLSVLCLAGLIVLSGKVARLEQRVAQMAMGHE